MPASFTVSVLPFSVILPPVVPPPLRLPIASSFARSSDTPAVFASVTCDASPMALPPDARSVPPLMVVTPVYVFAPLNVSTPAPAFVRPPVPLIAPEYVVEVPLPPDVSVPLTQSDRAAARDRTDGLREVVQIEDSRVADRHGARIGDAVRRTQPQRAVIDRSWRRCTCWHRTGAPSPQWTCSARPRHREFR